MLYKVCTRQKRWIGILESNLDWAGPYWTSRGYILLPYRDESFQE